MSPSATLPAGAHLGVRQLAALKLLALLAGYESACAQAMAADWTELGDMDAAFAALRRHQQAVCPWAAQELEAVGCAAHDLLAAGPDRSAQTLPAHDAAVQALRDLALQVRAGG